MKHTQCSENLAGFYGAFKYDLLFCFYSLPQKQARDGALFHLYLPDRLYWLDHPGKTVLRRDYEFALGDLDTAPVPRPAAGSKPKPKTIAAALPVEISSDLDDKEYAAMVRCAQDHIRKGDIFEVVLSRRFESAYNGNPSTLFGNLRRVNPSPYEFFIQLGSEQLVGASPEMFLRVEGSRVASCPISGTARRSQTPGQAAVIEDAHILRGLLNSSKDEAELTMCTDVDRNDKARICEAGSVRLVGRRQIEAYEGLFHTVDHVEGTLRQGFDGVDAFLSHMWTVTLTGAPKREAVKIIERYEPAPREFYAAAFGVLHFNGDLDAGTTIRTLHLKNGRAIFQSGASIVYDSVPEDEAAETHTKAASFQRILAGEISPTAIRPVRSTGNKKIVILVDNEDSFVHTLADYVRQTGAQALTYRHGTALETLLAHRPHLIVHSPGTGLPRQFDVPAMVVRCAEAKVPQFGVCLGLQGIFEAFGGRLGYLPNPHHGKSWAVRHANHPLFDGVPNPCTVGAYHSLYALAQTLPAVLETIATNDNGLIMALAHKTLPIWAVQFHPESLLSMQSYAGNRIIENVMQYLAQSP